MNDPSRSSGPSRPIPPTWEASVFGLVALREFANRCASGAPFSSPRCRSAQLADHARAERGLDQARHEATLAGQLDVAGIDLGDSSSNAPDAAIWAATSAPLGRFLVIGHEIHHVPFRWTDHYTEDLTPPPRCRRSTRSNMRVSSPVQSRQPMPREINGGASTQRKGDPP
jgi:hypothetical protein